MLWGNESCPAFGLRPNGRQLTVRRLPGCDLIRKMQQNAWVLQLAPNNYLGSLQDKVTLQNKVCLTVVGCRVWPNWKSMFSGAEASGAAPNRRPSLAPEMSLSRVEATLRGSPACLERHGSPLVALRHESCRMMRLRDLKIAISGVVIVTFQQFCRPANYPETASACCRVFDQLYEVCALRFRAGCG